MNGPPGTSTGSRPRRRARRRRRGAARGRPGRGRQPGELDRLQHRLVVLVLVAQHHLVDRRRGRSRSSDRQRALADVGEVVERLGAVEQRQVAADGARRLERVVHRGELGMQQRHAAVAVARATGPRRRRCARDPTRAGSSAGECAVSIVVVGERRDDGQRPLRAPRRARRRSRWRRARTRRPNLYGVRYATSAT